MQSDDHLTLSDCRISARTISGVVEERMVGDLYQRQSNWPTHPVLPYTVAADCRSLLSYLTSRLTKSRPVSLALGNRSLHGLGANL